MKNLEDYQKSNWIKRITDYEDIREQAEYWKGECERIEDNVIRQINEVNTKVDTLLFVVIALLPSKTNRNGSNSKEKAKEDKLVEEDKKGKKRQIKGVDPKRQKIRCKT